jgi:hypothetical protein
MITTAELNLNHENNFRIVRQLDFVALAVVNWYRTIPVLKYRNIKVAGLIFENCSEDFKLLSVKLFVNASPIFNLSTNDLEFLQKITNIVNNQGNNKYFDLSSLNLIGYILDKDFKINIVIQYSGYHTGGEVKYYDFFTQHEPPNTMNDFKLLPKLNYKNNDVICVKIGKKQKTNGLIISGINKNLINNINISYDNINFHKYITYENTFKNKVRNIFKNRFDVLADDTVYIPLNKNSKWNSYSEKGKKIRDGKIYVKFDLNDSTNNNTFNNKKNNKTYNLQVGAFLYNYLVNNCAPNYIHNFAVDGIEHNTIYYV